MEASAVNKRIEVIEVAHRYLDDHPTLDRVAAFEQAYREECTDYRTQEELLAQDWVQKRVQWEDQDEMMRKELAAN